MSYAPRIAALASLALVLGCEAPIDQHLEPQGSAQSGIVVAGAEAVLPVVGQLLDEGRPVAEASVCILYTQTCTKSDEDGYYKLEGVLAEEPEAIFAFHPKYVPLILPLQLRGDQYAYFDIAMVDGDAFERTDAGHIRFATELVSDSMDPAELQAMWGLQGTYRSNHLTVDAASGLSPELKPDTYVVEFDAQLETHCIAINGWGGGDAGSLAVPVLPGAITHIEQLCILAE